MHTDPIADMLTRIRNANKAMHESAAMPTSRMKEEIARLLRDEGYIKGYHVDKGESYDTLVVELKFGRNRERIRPEARVEARTAGLRAQGPPAARARRHGHGHPVHVHRSRHRARRRAEGHRRRGRVLHLVAA